MPPLRVVLSYEKNVFFSCVQKHMKEPMAAVSFEFGGHQSRGISQVGKFGQGLRLPIGR